MKLIKIIKTFIILQKISVWNKQYFDFIFQSILKLYHGFHKILVQLFSTLIISEIFLVGLGNIFFEYFFLNYVDSISILKNSNLFWYLIWGGANIENRSRPLFISFSKSILVLRCGKSNLLKLRISLTLPVI